MGKGFCYWIFYQVWFCALLSIIFLLNHWLEATKEQVSQLLMLSFILCQNLSQNVYNWIFIHSIKNSKYWAGCLINNTDSGVILCSCLFVKGFPCLPSALIFISGKINVHNHRSPGGMMEHFSIWQSITLLLYIRHWLDMQRGNPVNTTSFHCLSSKSTQR